MRIEIPEGAQRIIETLHRSGHRAYVVGGCVRDSLLLRVPVDWDICTSARPEEVMALFAGNAAPTGIKHGTVTVIVSDTSGTETYEVTTFRIDGEYKDNRRPEKVVFVRDVSEDLARRDFTVNAMAYDHEEGLIDLFGGRSDLEKEIIRCVGEPDRRFEEDALRILRGIRFASQLGFDIENETAVSLVRNTPLLDNIAAERIRVEFDKLLSGRHAARVLEQYRDVIARFIPEIRPMFGLDQENPFHLYDVWMHTLHAVDAIRTQASKPYEAGSAEAACPLLIAAFFHDIGKPPCKTVENGWGHFYGHEKTGAEMTNNIMHRLKYDNETRKTVIKLIEKHGIVFDPAGKQARRLLYRIGEDDLRCLIALERADVSAQHPDYVRERLANIAAFEERVDELIAEKQVFSMKDMAVNGKDLIKMGVPQGKEIGRIKNELMRMIVDGELENERDILIGQIKKILKQDRKRNKNERNKDI